MMQNPTNSANIITDTDESLTSLQTRISTLKDQIFSFDLSDKVNILKQIQSDIGESYKGILNTTLSIDQKFSTVITQMGRGVEFSRGIKLNFTDAADEVIRLGGSQQDALTLQENLISSTQKNLILTGDMGKELYATTKVTGVEASTLLNSFLDSGRSIDDIGDTMYEVVKTARDMGVSAKVVSAGVVGNLDKLNRFGFENGVEGLTRMAAKAATLRISMDSAFRTAEELMSPEKAVELSASLQRLGVASGELLDPLRLMDLAQNDVGELQNQLSGLFKQYTYFDEKSQSFQIMPGARRELKAIADELGYDIKEVNKMALAGADLDKKLSEISFGNLKIDEDTQEQIANLSTLNKETGKYEITTKSGDVQSLQDFISTFEGNEEGLKAYLSEQEEGGTNEEKLVNLAEEQLSSTNKMIAILNTMKQSMGLAVAGSPLGDQVLKTIKDYAFKPQEIVSKIAGPQGTVGEGIRGIKPEDLKEISKSLIKGDYSVIEKFGLGPDKLTEILGSLKDDVQESTTIDKQVQQVQPQTQTPIVTQTQKPEETQPTPINFTPNINLQGINIPKPTLTSEEIGNKVVLPKENKVDNAITSPTQMFVMDETNSNLVTLNETLLSINETIMVGDEKTNQIQDLLIEHLPKIDMSINDFVSMYNPEKIDLQPLVDKVNNSTNDQNVTETKSNVEIDITNIEKQNQNLNDSLSQTLDEFLLKTNAVDFEPLISQIGDIEYPKPNIQIETPNNNVDQVFNDEIKNLNDNLISNLSEIGKLIGTPINTEKSNSEIGIDEMAKNMNMLSESVNLQSMKISELPTTPSTIETNTIKEIVTNPTTEKNTENNINEKLVNNLASINQNNNQNLNPELTTSVTNNEVKNTNLNNTISGLDIKPFEETLNAIQDLVSLTISQPLNIEPPKLPETKIETVVGKQNNQTESKTEENKKIDINHTITIDVKGNNMDNNVLSSALNNPIFKQKLIQSTDLTKNSYISDYNSVMNIADAKYS